MVQKGRLAFLDSSRPNLCTDVDATLCSNGSGSGSSLPKSREDSPYFSMDVSLPFESILGAYFLWTQAAPPRIVDEHYVVEQSRIHYPSLLSD